MHGENLQNSKARIFRKGILLRTSSTSIKWLRAIFGRFLFWKRSKSYCGVDMACGKDKSVMWCYCGKCQNVGYSLPEDFDIPVLNNSVGMSENETLKDMLKWLPEYIDEEYPKGKVTDRGEAVMKISLFLMRYARNNNLKTK